MAENARDQADIEPNPSNENSLEVSKSSQQRKSFSKLRRELSDDELLSPAVQRLLIDEIERLEKVTTDLSYFKDEFHKSDKKAGVLEERFKTKISVELIHFASLSAGAALLGFAPAIWVNQPTATVLAIAGGLLVLVGILAKVVKP
ncbi:hypothetical protein MJP36_09645 [Pseudomonas palleroniana]|uniref:hypothetical protein n=1 Tax=Pseudomonas palleroniana TaxID=191390 RepID=UPI001FCB6F13|nr:hypothetical protein [Pseudomonas palleroniana]UOK40084.1 hypothetical protein MJP36_09645 [Pseudomonas palleroniana]